MSGALAVIDGPDLFGTAPSDLVPDVDQFADSTTARQRAERIRAQIVSYHQMRQDIADAFAYRDWAALGYSSWYGYLEGEFGPELQQLARHRGQRADAARDLRAGGLSTRQIAKVLDVDAKTVRNDLADGPAPAAVVGADGKTYPASRAVQAPAGTPAAPAAAGIEGPAGPVPSAADPRADADKVTDRPGSPNAAAERARVERETAAAFPIGCRVEWPTHAAAQAGAGEVRTIYPGGLALWVIDDAGFGHTVAPVRAHVVASPDAPNDSPAGRDLQESASSVPGEAVSTTVATTGQPGPDVAERRAQITANVGQLALAVNNLRALLRDATVADVPLFALRQQRDDLDRLIRRLEATTEGNA